MGRVLERFSFQMDSHFPPRLSPVYNQSHSAVGKTRAAGAVPDLADAAMCLGANGRRKVAAAWFALLFAGKPGTYGGDL